MGRQADSGVARGKGRRGRATAIWAGMLLAGAVGCQKNWHQHGHEFLDPYDNGNFTKAATAAQEAVKNCVAHDKVLITLEEATILRAAGRIQESDTAFAAADALIGDYEQWPTVRLSEEAAVALTTVRNVNYRGYLSDIVLLNCYRALNAMELGEQEKARTLLFRAAFAQRDIAAKYQSQLARAEQELAAKKKSKNYDAQQTLEARDKSGLNVTERIERDSGLATLAPYSDYLGPLADYLQGVFFLNTGSGTSDANFARTGFRRAAGMLGDNVYIDQDLAETERALEGGGDRRPAVTYVFFETGLAPYRDQVQIPLPLFLIGHHVPSVVLAFPILRDRDDYVHALTVRAGGGTYETTVVCDVDRVVKQEFKNNLSQAITRMVIAAVTKAAIDAATQQALKDQDPLLQLGASIAMFAYQAAMNQADLRTWRTLPKQFQVARVSTPSDGNLTLQLADGSGSIPISLSPDARTNVVYVKSIRRGIAPTVRVFRLE
jgi:hypothetical protein